jgi:hypothetical protein
MDGWTWTAARRARAINCVPRGDVGLCRWHWASVRMADVPVRENEVSLLPTLDELALLHQPPFVHHSLACGRLSAACPAFRCVRRWRARRSLAWAPTAVIINRRRYHLLKSVTATALRKGRLRKPAHQTGLVLYGSTARVQQGEAGASCPFVPRTMCACACLALLRARTRHAEHD